MIELQLIDTNCNDCKYMVRNIYKKKHFDTIEQERQRLKFSEELNKELFIAYAERDKAKLTKLKKLKFQPSIVAPLNYGFCKKKEVDISFLPATCMPQNSECFKHRKHE